MSHDQTTTGFDAPNPLSREGEPTVKWPILAQLPWVGDPLAGAEPLPRSAALPFEPPAGNYSLPPADAGEPSTKSPALRLVEPQHDDAEEEYAAVEPLDRRLHAAPLESRSATEPPHLNLHRFTPAEPLRAVVEEPEYREARSAANAPPRQQYRRIDPPQLRTTAAVSLHAPAESLAARFYQWHASARPQLGLIAFAGLILLGGGLYWAAFGKARSQPAASTVEAWVEAPPQPLMGSSATAPVPAANALPTPPTLDLTPKSTSGDPRAGAPATREPAPAVDVSTSDDPIAAWLHSQPLITPRVEAPKVVAEPVAVAPIAAAAPPQLVSPSPAPSPIVRDETIMPTPVLPGLSLSPMYPTTPYPPFNFSLCQPPTAMNAPSVAETLGPPIEQLSTPR